MGEGGVQRVGEGAVWMDGRWEGQGVRGGEGKGDVGEGEVGGGGEE